MLIGLCRYKIGWILKYGSYWVSLFAREQMPNHVESAIDDSTDDADSNKTYTHQLLTQINNKTLFI